MPWVPVGVLTFEDAMKIYKDLGELSPQECHYISRRGHLARQRYFSNIYGFHAAKIAREVYKTWEKRRTPERSREEAQ